MCWSASSAIAQNADPDNVADETMLMFVGEKLDVLTIATRREESAVRAPAVAQVITRRQIRERGLRTLSEALALVPGFYIAEKEGGGQAYLRGIPGGVLFLYDCVPLGSETTKSIQFLDHEISLASIKRIEIIRGPGSVLWGPDAYAGVVNIVPLNGSDLQGWETGLTFGHPGSQTGAYAMVGNRRGHWDTFFSASARRSDMDDTAANIVRFWGDDQRAVPPDERTGIVTPDDAYFVEATGRIAYGDALSLTARIADAARPYTMSDQNSGNAWLESTRTPTGFLKLEGRRELHFDSALRFNASFRWLDPEYEIIDRTVSQKERTGYAELLYDKAFSGWQGLLTVGLSYRQNRVSGAPNWDGYLPDFLGPENENLAPILTQVDYETRLKSIFGQYSHKLGPVDITLGLRHDDHDVYESAMSYQAAAVWSPIRPLAIKLLHGTAYRTPTATQLRDGYDGIQPEEIENTSIQLAWMFPRQWETSLTAFRNRVEDHVREDPYAGLSNPNTQTIDGVEAEVRWTLNDAVELGAALTLLDNSGPSEVYRYNDFTFIDEDGNLVKHYVDLTFPYEIGAKRLFNLTAIWRPLERLRLSARLRYIGSRDLIYPRGETITRCEAVWLTDVSVLIEPFILPNTNLSLAVTNLFDRDYHTPGTYSLIDGAPLGVEAVFRWRW